MGNVVLITGAARRLGAATAEYFHQRGFRVLVHYQHSETDAEALVARLNQRRANSAHALQANLLNNKETEALAQAASNHWGQLDVLINNASQFYPTPMGQATEQHWHALMGSNLKAPLLLAQALLPVLRKSPCASIVNMVDLYASHTLPEHTIYCAAKAGLAALTRNLARDLGPHVRVNGVAPGAILWPSAGQDNADSIVAATPLKRCGTAEEIAAAVYWLATEATFITGHILPVDGGRGLVLAGN